jgi:hypothetical protein
MVGGLFCARRARGRYKPKAYSLIGAEWGLPGSPTKSARMSVFAEPFEMSLLVRP